MIKTIRYRLIKDFFDRFFAFIALIFFSPLLFSISILLIITHGWDFIFLQNRPGLRGNKFKIIKFKTMRNTDLKNKKPDDGVQRITNLGRFLRNTSIDEIPSLINILKGEMSFVGPRPLLEEYLEHYSEEEMKRHNVKPGLTGWAQINGRNCISWETKFKFDIWYVSNQSFIVDLKILLISVWKVLKKDNVNKNKEITMPLFSRNK